MSAAELPPLLGPFRTLQSRHESEAGSVLAGQGPDGRPVDLVRLGLGPSSDPAARDRFRDGVARLDAQSPGTVLAADLDAPSPWVALAPGMADQARAASAPAAFGATTATRLLSVAFPPDLAGLPSRGPQFSPYWRGRRPQGPLGGPALPAAPAAWWRRWALAAFVLLVLLLLLLWWLLTRPLVEAPQPTPAPPPTVPLVPPLPPTPLPGSPSPGPSGGPSDVPVVFLGVTPGPVHDTGIM